MDWNQTMQDYSHVSPDWETGWRVQFFPSYLNNKPIPVEGSWATLRNAHDFAKSIASAEFDIAKPFVYYGPKR